MPVVLDVRVVSGTGGGPEKTILNSPRFLERAGYRMLCAYMHPPSDTGFDVIQRRARDHKAPLIAIPDRGPMDWRILSKLLEICRSQKVRIWHGHDYKSNAFGLLVNNFWPMKLVTTVHGWVEHTRRTPLYYAIDRLCLRFYQKVFCVSPDLQRSCRSAGIPSQRCELLENGIDLESHTRRNRVADAKSFLGLDSGQFLIGGVGRLSPEKGFDVLINAACRLLREGLNISVVLVGDGNERARLENLAEQLGCRNRVRFVGFQSDTAPWYEAMDVFALSSVREGLPNVLMEAMAFEVPIVATRIAGVPRLIDNERNGLLVQPGNIDELASGLRRLLESRELRGCFGSAGRATVEKRFSFAARMERLAACYNHLLQETRS